MTYLLIMKQKKVNENEICSQKNNINNKMEITVKKKTSKYKRREKRICKNRGKKR